MSQQADLSPSVPASVLESCVRCPVAIWAFVPDHIARAAHMN